MKRFTNCGVHWKLEGDAHDFEVDPKAANYNRNLHNDFCSLELNGCEELWRKGLLLNTSERVLFISRTANE